jgi:nucleotide-binding universal stress UspA family protein
MVQHDERGDKMSKHVLVAVSTSSDGKALAFAIEKARATGARLTALHVVDMLPWWAIVGAEHGCVDGIRVANELAQQVEPQCNKILSECPDLDARAMSVPIENTSIARTITRVAETLDADVIVLGSGRTSKWLSWRDRLSDDVRRYTQRTVDVVSPAFVGGKEGLQGNSNRDPRQRESRLGTL